MNRRAFCITPLVGSLAHSVAVGDARNRFLLGDGASGNRGCCDYLFSPRVDRHVVSELENAWMTLPPTPALPASTDTGTIPVDGADLFYARFGKGEPVLLLHGGLANSSYWGYQASELSKRYQVIVVDLRGQGRSTMGFQQLSYELMAYDVIKVMDALRIPRFTIVGWSDGAIIGLMLALSDPRRVTRLFSFGANYNLIGLIPGGAHSPVFSKYTARTVLEYQEISPEPSKYGATLQALRRIWSSGPNITRSQLITLRLPVGVSAGDHDEIIRRAHTEELASLIPSATLLIMPGVSHFAMLQKPEQFTNAMLHFLQST